MYISPDGSILLELETNFNKAKIVNSSIINYYSIEHMHWAIERGA